MAVGGTDFGDTYHGKNAAYWKAGNSIAFGSARSYIDEIPWNDSCASVLLTGAQGYATPYGSAGFCNSADGEAYLTTAAGSGGPSRCVTGARAKAGVVGATGSTACNSSKGKDVASNCVFYDVTQGDMDVNCTGTVDCYLPSGAYGVLSTADGDDAKAYAAHAGWDFATGIGKVNVENLVNNW